MRASKQRRERFKRQQRIGGTGGDDKSTLKRIASEHDGASRVMSCGVDLMKLPAAEDDQPYCCKVDGRKDHVSYPLDFASSPVVNQLELVLSCDV